MPRKKPETTDVAVTEVLAILNKTEKMLAKLSLSDILKILEGSQSLTDSCAQMIGKGVDALDKASASMSKQLQTMKTLKGSPTLTASASDIMGMTYQGNGYPNGQGNSNYQGNLSPYTPVSPRPQPNANGNEKLQDGQIKLEIPHIQHLGEDFQGDDFSPHQQETFGEPSNYSDPNGINLPTPATEVPELGNNIPLAFQATLDAPTE